MERNILVPQISLIEDQEFLDTLYSQILSKNPNINLDPRLFLSSGTYLIVNKNLKIGNNKAILDLYIILNNKQQELLEKICEGLELLLSVNKDFAKQIFETKSRCYLNKQNRHQSAKLIQSYLEYFKIEIDKKELGMLEIFLNRGIINNIIIAYFLLESIKAVLKQKKIESKVKVFIEPLIRIRYDKRIIEIRADIIVVEESKDKKFNNVRAYRLKSIIEVKRIRLKINNKIIDLNNCISNIVEKIFKNVYNILTLEINVSYILIIQWLDEKSILKKYNVTIIIFEKLIGKILSIDKKWDFNTLKEKLESMFRVKIIVGNVSKKVFKNIVNIFI